jgi:biopolymer transport protein ExbD
VPKVQPIPNAPSAGRGRRGRHVRVSTALAEINVVPLVDVMLVLLIIFMVAAPMMTQGMQVNLPQAKKSTNPPAQKTLYVTIPADFGRSNKVQIGDDAPFSADVLAERMRQALMTRDDKSVFIRTDQGVTMQQFMGVTDKLKEAGVEKVAIATRPAGTKQ